MVPVLARPRAMEFGRAHRLGAPCELVHDCIGYEPRERPRSLVRAREALYRLVAERVSA